MDSSSPNSAGGAEVMLSVAHHALLSGLAQFIPLPFADDLADRAVRRAMVQKLLRRRGRVYDAGRVKPLYTGRPKGLASSAFSLAKGLVLKPVKKVLRTVFIVATVRRALLEATEALCLGHTVDRLLATGWFPNGATAEQLEADALRVVSAVQHASRGADWRGLRSLVRQSAKVARGGDVAEEPPAEVEVEGEAALPPEERRRLWRATQELFRRLTSPQGRSLLANFDREVDGILARTP